MTLERYKQICAFLRKLIEATPWEGMVYTVGGCCRDMVLGEKIHDIDLAVSLPDGGVAFAEWLHDKGLTKGEPIYFRKYGTAKLRLKEFPQIELELVQTRSEKYTDRNSRNPATAFGSIEDDCLRRDLTINSLYQSVSTGEVLDLSGRGLADIEAHLIRTPMEPDMTFDDDPVRILRAIRFAARYGWEIDPAALEAMTRHVDRLQIISPERLYGEFEKIITCPWPDMALDLLRRVGAMPYLVPELCDTFEMGQSRFHAGSVWEHTLATIAKVPPDPCVRMAALLHDIGKTVSREVGADGEVHFPRHDRRCRGIVAAVLSRFRCRKPFVDRVIFLCVNHEAAKSWGPRAEKMRDADLRRLEYKCTTQQRFEALLALIDGDNRAYAPEHCMPGQVKAIRKRAAELRKRDGRPMYGYHLPVKPSRIARLLRTSDPKAVEAWQSRLLDRAFEDPRLTREQMVKVVEQELKQEGKPEVKPDGKPTRRRRASR
ncbi:MAG: HD domain-containing protein [Muribaculaceae bacterium]|nr:HD domain-containing protein [Muribaculaceae bacterium]